MTSSDNPIFKLIDYIESNEYKGYDPYDGLNSKLLEYLPLPWKYARIAWIQFFKVCPINFRKYFLISKGTNPKGLGLILSSYCNLFKSTQDEAWLRKAHNIFKLLIEVRSKYYDNYCWGYNFNWQSRAFYVPKNTPTIVNTSFIGHALLDLYALNHDEKILDIVDSSCNFILKDLNRFEDDKHICFSYTPIDRLKVHNASILGAGLIARYSKLKCEDKFDNFILKSFNYLSDYQRSDGSWYYAETDYQSWIDSFHTAFNLASLQEIHSHFRDNEKVDKTIKSGQSFYLNNFFGIDGESKYYNNSLYPIDIHSSSMALAYLSKYVKDERGLIDKIYKWKIANMFSEKGYFYFRKNKYYINKIPYMRWSCLGFI